VIWGVLQLPLVRQKVKIMIFIKIKAVRVVFGLSCPVSPSKTHSGISLCQLCMGSLSQKDIHRLEMVQRRGA
jgi:hypothetical protein